MSGLRSDAHKMLEPLTALSLASATIQVIDFSSQVLETTDRISKSTSGAAAEVEKLQQSASQLLKFSSRLDTSASNGDDTLSPDQMEA